MLVSPPRRADGSNVLFNNATLSLASYLARRGLAVRVQPLVGPGWQAALMRALDEGRPRVVAVSCKWWDTLFGATEVARLVKEHRPGTLTVSGGQTATAFAADLVGRGHFDAVVRGDGEEPLYDFATGHPVSNLTLRRGEGVEHLPLQYVQGRSSGLEDLRLLPDLRAVTDEVTLAHVGVHAPFVWTGKGCRSACLFCAGSALGHRRLFGRTGYFYRPLEEVLHDIEALAPWTGGAFLFDFDPVTDPDRGRYYLELFRALPRRRYHAIFHCWSLPGLAFLEELANTFATCLVSFDAQTYSEPLRQRLAARNWIKPFAANASLEEHLAFCRGRPNVACGLYGILGLATETADDVARSEAWIDHLLREYIDVFAELQITPLSIEPGSLVDRDPDKYGMVALRRSFDDYMEFTRLAYRRSAGFHEAPYDPALPHPFGLHLAGDRPDRVYRDFRRLKAGIEGALNRRAEERAWQSLQVGPEEVRLTLRNRSLFQDDWRLVAWAASVALGERLRRVVVEAGEAWMFVPPLAVLELDEAFEWVASRLPGIRRALEEGRLDIEIRGRPGQIWGAWEQIGARLRER
jgi:hypothetical protein